MTKQLKHILLH